MGLIVAESSCGPELSICGDRKPVLTSKSICYSQDVLYIRHQANNLLKSRVRAKFFLVGIRHLAFSGFSPTGFVSVSEAIASLLTIVLPA